jgi:putative transcriptional regulator
MVKKLNGKALAKFEAERDVWQEVLDALKEIKAGGASVRKLKPNPMSFVCG